MRNWDETVAYLYALLPAYQRTGDASNVRFDLSRTHALLDALGNPERYLAKRSIHVAGTNGKGSVSSMMAAALTKVGFRTGLYTSPHLRCFTERMRIDGTLVARQWVIEFVETHQAMIESLQPTFFELTVGMAFSWFRDQNVDYAVVEVGMGGRLDSTNVIDPLLCIITNIGLEHTEFLGDTRAKIAAEKAGIIKPNTPVIIGEWDAETAPVYEAIAAQHNAPIHWAPQTYKIIKRTYWQDRELKDPLVQLCLFQRQKDNPYEAKRFFVKCDLLGDYQAPNIVTAVTAMDVLYQHLEPEPVISRKYKINTLRRGIAEVKSLTGLQGRFDLYSTKPDFLLDVTHNAHGLKQFTARPYQVLGRYPKRHWVIGMVKKPEWLDFLAVLLRANSDRDSYYWVAPDLPRARPAAELRDAAAAMGMGGDAHPSVAAGIQAAQAAAGAEDLVVVLGSTFVVAEALDYLESQGVLQAQKRRLSPPYLP